jgi:HD-GYP domain-containing protein (c-di-GMP phosphodiesterase class II)
MLINIFNVILIILITFVTYKYFALREKSAPGLDRTMNYINGFGAIADRVEGYDSPHAMIMADMAEKIAREKGMSEDEIISLRYAAILHDIGEILLPRNLLKTSEKLDEENLFLLRTHPLLGELQLRNKDFPYDEVPTLVRWHHERFDGTGYPDSLKGEEIPLSCRILALVDAVSAMKEERPYRKKAMKMNEIVKELDLKSGIQFDPELVEIWKMLFLKAQTGGEN